MATLNLGRIKPVFRGAYSGSTAYVIDDIVTSGGSTYICIQAHGAGTQAVSQTAYWTLMAEGGDVASTLTTQGDVLYRDGSGLQRLAAGTAGQVLQTGGSGANPSWAAVSSAYKKLSYYSDNSRVVSSQNSGDTDVFTMTTSYVKDDASTKLKIFARTPIHNPQQGAMQLQLKFTHTDGTETHFYGARGYIYTGQANSSLLDCAGVLTGMKAGTYTIKIRHSSRGHNHNGGHVTNPSNSDDNRYESDTDVQGQANNDSPASRTVLIIEEIE